MITRTTPSWLLCLLRVTAQWVADGDLDQDDPDAIRDATGARPDPWLNAEADTLPGRILARKGAVEM